MVKQLSKKETRTLSNTIHKINAKWIKDRNIRPETIKLLEANIGKALSDINHNKILYDPPPRILEIKARINKWDLIKINKFKLKKKRKEKAEEPEIKFPTSAGSSKKQESSRKISALLTIPKPLCGSQ